MLAAKLSSRSCTATGTGSGCSTRSGCSASSGRSAAGAVASVSLEREAGGGYPAALLGGMVKVNCAGEGGAERSSLLDMKLGRTTKSSSLVSAWDVCCQLPGNSAAASMSVRWSAGRMDLDSLIRVAVAWLNDQCATRKTGLGTQWATVNLSNAVVMERAKLAFARYASA